MKKGDKIVTPRFLTVTIEEMFFGEKEARESGYHEPTHYDDGEYLILGKHAGTNHMIFAAIKR